MTYVQLQPTEQPCIQSVLKASTICVLHLCLGLGTERAAREPRIPLNQGLGKRALQLSLWTCQPQTEVTVLFIPSSRHCLFALGGTARFVGPALLHSFTTSCKQARQGRPWQRAQCCSLPGGHAGTQQGRRAVKNNTSRLAQAEESRLQGRLGVWQLQLLPCLKSAS